MAQVSTSMEVSSVTRALLIMPIPAEIMNEVVYDQANIPSDCGPARCDGGSMKGNSSHWSRCSGSQLAITSNI